VKRLAHTLKGSVMNLGADKAADAAHALELPAATADHEKINQSFCVLESEIDRLLPAISNLAEAT